MIANTTRRCLVVTGSRRGHSRVAEMLDAWVAQYGEPDVLILGDADGVDMQAWAWACKRGSNEITCQHIAEWERFGNAAGPRRNAAMIAHAGPCADLLAFPDEHSKGTWDCVRQASAAGLRVHVVPMEPAKKAGGVMAKVLMIGSEDAGELHLLLPASVVAVHHSRDAGVVLTLVSGLELRTTCDLEKVTGWLGWTGEQGEVRHE